MILRSAAVDSIAASCPESAAAARASRSKISFADRVSPLIPREVCPLIRARCLVIFLDLPPSLMVIVSPSSASTSSSIFFGRFGRPLGLPLCPLVQRVCSGGLPYPTFSVIVRLSLRSRRGRQLFRGRSTATSSILHP